MNLCLVRAPFETVWLLQWVLSFGLIIGEHSWYEQINNPSVQLGSHTVYMEYGYFTPSCRDFICLERLLFPVQWYSQVLHLYVTPSCADFLWLIRLGLWEYSLLQTSHWYFFPWCIDWMCAVRILFVVASYSHCFHGYFEVKISSPLMTQGGQPCKQQNSAQGGPPCAS